MNQNYALPGKPGSLELFEKTTRFLTQLDAARSEQNVIDATLDQLRGYGATMMLAWLIPDPDSADVQLAQAILHAWPAYWTRKYIRQKLDRHDPVLRLMQQGKTDVVWHEMTEEELGDEQSRRVMAGAAAVGMKDGYTTSLSTLDGRLFLFTMAGEWIDVTASDKRAVATVAQHAVGAMLRLRHIREKVGAARLTKREHQAIQLATKGEKNEHIAIQMGISRRGAEQHLANARKKLNARNTNDAIAQAMRFGIIR